jgi:glutamate racemase
VSNQPIGIFDSGVGGLSIWKAIHDLLPFESTIYLADSANAPYGDKDRATIQQFSIKNTELLLKLGAKMIVVACNTATTNAIALLRETYDVPFIGIEPATKPAAIATKTGKIGILATKGTLASELFLNTSKQFRGDVEIIETVGTGLVQLIEANRMSDCRSLLVEYLDPMVNAGVDSIVLGCTHYPFLRPIMKEILPDHISIIDSGEAVAKYTKNVLEKMEREGNDSNAPSHAFYTNGDIAVLQSFVKAINVDIGISKKMEF